MTHAGQGWSRLQSKIRNFRLRVRENRKVTRSIWKAGFLAVRRRICREPDHIFHGLSIDRFPFKARYRDWLAIQEVIFEEEYRVVLELLEGKVRPVVVDGGANIGMFSLYLFSYFPFARVYAYEASSGAFRILNENRRLNPGLEWSVNKAAFWDSAEVLPFTNMEWSTSSRVGNSKGQCEYVQGISLEGVLRDVRTAVDLMKIDIEGAEGRFICGNARQLENVCNLLVELHPDVCDGTALLRTLQSRWKGIYKIPGRRSAKPLLLATDEEVNLPRYCES